MRYATHGGAFHADDVLSSAVMFLMGLVTLLVRTTNTAKLAEAHIGVDVGGRYDPITGDYDHHQEGGAGVRPNGIPYASFGLIWKRYGAELCGSSTIAEVVDKRLVQVVDATDVGYDLYTGLKYQSVVPCSMVDVIFAFNPPWYEKPRPEDFDRQFLKAVEVAKVIIGNAIVDAKGASIAREILDRAIAGATHPNILVLDRSCPRRELVLDDAPEVLFVVLPPDNGGQWMVRVVQECMGIMKARKYLPAAWAGKQGVELVRVTGVSDANFCHNSRFIAGAKSKEGAMELAKLAVSW